ncbi:EexN family lipoprotein [Klebsiella pneumoniae]|uniref:EexN family lipoprotein n=1 Tax=Klebsiella pneumoniae TaxID=573 RepID=UPI000B41DB69|nr:EexN family lipoprotein [Klebsiella pneumoniae]
MNMMISYQELVRTFPKTTKWYKEHPDELKLVYEKCQKSGDATENCKNANEAHYQIKQLNAPTPDLNNLEE